MTGLSVVVVVRDEAEMLPGCLARLGFADEVVVVVDDRTVDDSADLARAVGAAVHEVAFEDFAQMKNAALRLATQEWVLLVDADERVSTALAAEVRAVLEAPGHDAYEIPVVNYFLGRRMTAGDWTSERPRRLMRRVAAAYTGAVHEQLQVRGGAGTLDEALVHFSHRSVGENLRKAERYGDLSARARLGSGAPAMTSRRLLWTLARELLRRLVRHRGYRDGFVGVADAVSQATALAAADIRLWELQQSVDLAEQYRRIDRDLP
jgi:glycosyltransferase involved in cell wall biosynthesis